MKGKLIANFYVFLCVGLLATLTICKGLAVAGECTAGNIGYCVFWKTPWLIYPNNPEHMRIYFEVHTGVDNDWDHRQVIIKDHSEMDVNIYCEKITVDGGYDSRVCHALVTNLCHSKEYHYTVKARRHFNDDWTTHDGSFWTAPHEDTTKLEFYGFGDNKYIEDDSDRNYISLVVDSMMRHNGRKTFVINTGDIVYLGGEDRGISFSGTSRWDKIWRLKHMRYFFMHIPMMTALGNHDFQTECGHGNCPSNDDCNNYGCGDARIYYRYFPWPHDAGNNIYDAYYMLSYGPAHFWSIDTWPCDSYCGHCPHINSDSAQVKWLEKTLKNVENDHRQWKIVFMHSPLYSPGDCNLADGRKYLEPLFDKYGVDIVLAGHEHYYSRTPTDETLTGNTIPYLVLGGGGAGLSHFTPSDDFVAEQHHHFAYFEIDHDQMHVQVICNTGDQLDEFYLDRNPVAKFDADPTKGNPPLTVNFTDKSTGHRYQYDWDFGDGTEHSQDRNPTHTYEEEGIYAVKLTVKSYFNSSTHTATIHVGPVADFDADPIEGQLPLSVYFNYKSKGDVLTCLWDFGDGTTSTEQNPVHEYNDNGKFSVKLTVNGQKTSDTKTRHEYIKVEPYADFTFNPNGCNLFTIYDVCTVQFTDNSWGDALTYRWDFGDGCISKAQNPSHGFASGGGSRTYKVQLVVTDSKGFTDSKTGYINVRCIGCVPFFHR